MNRRVLLLEPGYKNKYPPMGLMKLASYHRLLGDDVRFFKGSLKEFVVQEIYEIVLKKLYNIDNSIVWEAYKLIITQYIRTGRKIFLDEVRDNTFYSEMAIDVLKYYRKYYREKSYFKEKKWDRVCVTTLFTFHWKVTIETINFAKEVCKNEKEVWVGGILASVVPEEVERQTGIKPWVGLLDKPGIMDDNELIVENMFLDYSILDETDYKYPESNAYYAYMTRGCVRHCKFCVVPNIEPEFVPFITLNEKIEVTAKKYGERQNLLLLDNNVLASPCFPLIVAEIKEHGFFKNAVYYEPNWLDIVVKNLREGVNERACLNRIHSLMIKLLCKLKNQNKQQLYNLLSDNMLINKHTVRKEAVLAVYPEIRDLYEKKMIKIPKKRYVDFNQGVDARLITEENMKLLSELPINPLRIAFDHWKDKSIYENAIALAANHGIKMLSNYLLYNFDDKPIELYYRLRMNIELCEIHNINIYSFPMKYHPIKDPEYFQNRNYVGKHWNRKFIRAVQAVLNSTKGKIGNGKSFFYEAFGENESGFYKILYMPEVMIIYRRKYKDNGMTEEWWQEFQKYRDNREILNIIERNNYSNISDNPIYKEHSKLLNFYKLKR